MRTCEYCGEAFKPQRRSSRFCSYSCSSRSRPRPSVEERLWPRLKRVDSGCWEYQMGKDRDGYGLCRGLGEHRAHRVAWAYCFGAIPDGLLIIHKCDNPSCCNPFHLRIGTPLDNMRDKMEKGREYFPVGQDAANAKLTTDQVLEIRQLHADGVTQRKIATQFVVGFKAINKIVLRQRWKHL